MIYSAIFSRAFVLGSKFVKQGNNPMKQYLNRQEAGKTLAGELRAYTNRSDVIVLALPRGGVPVAFEIAKALHVPLDVFIVRKLGVPGHSELAMGAMAMGHVTVFNDEIIQNLSISSDAIKKVMDAEQEEIKRRERSYRGNHVFPVLRDKTIILVDDGIATGATMRAAVKALYQFHPASVIIAIPVADKFLCDKIQLLVDDFICPLRPTQLYAVGAWYEDFSQTEDEEVRRLLKESYMAHLDI